MSARVCIKGCKNEIGDAILTVFDPEVVGDTVGGNTLKGWDMCPKCGGGQLSDRAAPAERWRLSKGDRSVETGDLRIRAEGSGGNAQALMRRVVRLPDLELRFQLLHRALIDEVCDTLKDGGFADAAAHLLREESWTRRVA